VLFPLSAVSIPALRQLVRLNPVTPFTLAYQEALFAGRFPPPQLWLEMAAVALVAWVVGCWIFDRLRETLVEAL
jgi:ABC-type polysaccharide/polyol phosphate export permease